MQRKHQKTLEKVFQHPVSGTISWKDIEALLIALGAELTEGRGSRVRIILNATPAIFHRPHPRKETDKGAVVSVREFLTKAGVQYHGI